MSVIAIVTARGGSKGLPHKNLRELNGQSLVARALETATQSTSIDRIVLTSDNDQILRQGIESGCEIVVRPPELAGDTSRSTDCVIHAAHAVRADRNDVIVLLQPTSPLRTVADVDEAVGIYRCGGLGSVVQVAPCEPAEVLKSLVVIDDRVQPVHSWEALESPRQDLPACFRPTGGVYVVALRDLVEHGRFIVPQVGLQIITTHRAIDIDTEADLIEAARRLRNGD